MKFHTLTEATFLLCAVNLQEEINLAMNRVIETLDSEREGDWYLEWINPHLYVTRKRCADCSVPFLPDEAAFRDCIDHNESHVWLCFECAGQFTGIPVVRYLRDSVTVE